MTPNIFQAATLKKIWVEATLKSLRWHPMKSGYILLATLQITSPCADEMGDSPLSLIL